MKRTPPNTKPRKSTKVAKPSAKKVPAAAKKAPAKKAAPAAPQPQAVSGTKQSQLITLLGSSTGATLAQMMSLTGWQAHTVRGMISGSLRKRLGLDVQTQMEEGVRIYRIVGGSAQ